MKHIGEIIDIEGKKYRVTYVSGENYSYEPYEMQTEPFKFPEEKTQKPAGRPRRSRKA